MILTRIFFQIHYSRRLLITYWLKSYITICKTKGTRAVLVVENSTYNSSFNINKISLFEKENTVFTDSKDRQVKHYYPNNKAVTLRTGCGQKEFRGFKEISNLSFKYMEFVLKRNHFCNWCWSSNYWDFFNRKAGLNTSFVFLKQFRQFHFLKPWDVFVRLLKWAKMVRLGKRWHSEGTRKRMSTKSVSRYKQLLTTQVDNLHEVSHFNRKRLVLWTTPKTLEPQWIKGIAKKSYEYEVGYTQEKSNCPVSNTSMPLSGLSTMSRSSIGANSDWIHQLNSENNGPVFFFI